MNADTLTQDRLKELLHYDPETGLFTWLPRGRKCFNSDKSHRAWNAKNANRIAGNTAGRGYCTIRHYAKNYAAHRLAFLYMTGEFPAHEVDHINGSYADNRWCNLRVVTHAENCRNAKRNTLNTSGHTGVSWHKRQRRWCAYIHANGKLNYIGCFTSVELALLARKQAELDFEYHYNHGRP